MQGAKLVYSQCVWLPGMLWPRSARFVMAAATMHLIMAVWTVMECCVLLLLLLCGSRREWGWPV